MKAINHMRFKEFQHLLALYLAEENSVCDTWHLQAFYNEFARVADGGELEKLNKLFEVLDPAVQRQEGEDK